jgi:hypothetical protein
MSADGAAAVRGAMVSLEETRMCGRGCGKPECELQLVKRSQECHMYGRDRGCGCRQSASREFIAAGRDLIGASARVHLPSEMRGPALVRTTSIHDVHDTAFRGYLVDLLHC